MSDCSKHLIKKMYKHQWREGTEEMKAAKECAIIAEQYAAKRTAALLKALTWIRDEGYKNGSGIIHKYVSDAISKHNEIK